jgi:pSer/pThr/pTyr-binding forkhead associated (FHA) protein
VIDIVLLVGRLLLVALLYLFLFAVMKTGIGLVKGQRKKDAVWTIAVARGPKELRGVKIDVTGPVVVGRAPGADIVIGTSFVSGRHARFSPMGEDLIVEDLESTNGTVLNGTRIYEPTAVRNGDTIAIGNVDIKVGHS